MGLIKNLASGKLFYIKMEILFFAKDVVCSFDKNFEIFIIREGRLGPF